MAHEPAPSHLGDRRYVVGVTATRGFPDLEVAVIGLARQPVLEHHQRAHHVGALHVADIYAFNPQRRVGQTQRFLNILQPSRSGGEVAGPLEFVLLQRLFGVPLHGFSQRLLVAAARYPQCHPRTAQTRQPSGQLVGIGRQTGHQDFPRHWVGGFVCGAIKFGLIGVELSQELLDQPCLAGITGIARLFDDPTTLAANPAAADMEHLDSCFQLVVSECHHIGVGAVAEHHGLLLQSPLQRREIVTKPCGSFVIELLGCRIHLLLQTAGIPVGFAGQKVAEVSHDLAMLLGADPSDTRRRALVDVAKQARSVDLLVPFEYSGRAGARGEDAGEQVEGLPDGPGMRVWPEIAHAFSAWAAIDHQPREFLVEGDGQHGVGLVVAVADVESGVELLDPVVFQLQRLDLGVDHRPLHLGGGGDHLPGPRVQAGDVSEVGGQPAAQAHGLADIDHPSVLVPESVYAGLDRDGPGRGAVSRGIRHPSRLVRSADSHDAYELRDERQAGVSPASGWCPRLGGRSGRYWASSLRTVSMASTARSLSTAWIAINGMYSSSGRSIRAQRAPAGNDRPTTSDHCTRRSPSRLRTDSPADPTRSLGRANSSTSPAITRPSPAIAT